MGIMFLAFVFTGILVAIPNPFEDFKFLASVYSGQAFLCGGTFITNDVVLTAAHCVVGHAGGLVVIDHFQEIIHNGQEKYSKFGVRCVKPSRRFSYDTVPESDIAILKLNRKRQSPVYIDLDYSRYGRDTGLEVAAVEWEHYPDGSKNPVSVPTKILPLANCSNGLASASDQVLCVAFSTPPQIEFGGPLIYHALPVPILVGIFSWLKPDNDGLPSIFTRVDHHVRWISTFTKFGSEVSPHDCPPTRL